MSLTYSVLGEPESISAIKDVEYLFYRLLPDDNVWRKDYYVRIINGKVNAFGRLGDFDSTKPPTVRIEKDETIKQDTNIKTEEEPDLYKSLLKLKDLKEQGLLTEEEFELKRKEILKKH